MTDESICREFLEITLEIPIGRVVVDWEKSLVYHPEYKGVRLDVYARDDNQRLFNVEMQIVNRPALERRARYYSSELDMEALKSGRSYGELPDSYVIFVCDFDPFGKSHYRYTFTNTCAEEKNLPLSDGRRTVFLSTRGTNTSEVPETLVNFLNYIRADPTQSMADSDDAFIARLQNAVWKVKASRDMEGRFMTLQEMLQDERAEGLTEGLVEGLIVLLESKGPVPEKLRKQIEAQTDPGVLKYWIKLASQANSIDAFCRQI